MRNERDTTWEHKSRVGNVFYAVLFAFATSKWHDNDVDDDEDEME